MGKRGEIEKRVAVESTSTENETKQNIYAMDNCKKVCENEYLKEHLRVVKEQGSKTPDKNTLKLIKGDCMRKICNPGCKNTFSLGVKNSFHSDYTEEEQKFLKGLGVLSWCHAKPMQVGNIKPFNIMNLTKTVRNEGGNRHKKNKTKKHKTKKHKKH